MNKGKISFATVELVDMQAPDTGFILSVDQVDNHSVNVTLSLPTTDSNGDPISGLAGIGYGYVLPGPDGEVPFVDHSNFETVVNSAVYTAVDPSAETFVASLKVADEHVGLTVIFVWYFHD